MDLSTEIANLDLFSRMADDLAEQMQAAVVPGAVAPKDLQKLADRLRERTQKTILWVENLQDKVLGDGEEKHRNS